MEKFKALEKEMKTKAYSKEGIARSVLQSLQNVDNATMNMVEWIENSLDHISEQEKEINARVDEIHSQGNLHLQFSHNQASVR